MLGSFVPFMVLWVVLAAAVVALIVYRRSVSSHEDDALHLGQAGVVTQQVSVAQKLEQIDKWGKLLTIIVVAYGLILGILYVIASWSPASRTGV